MSFLPRVPEPYPSRSKLGTFRQGRWRPFWLIAVWLVAVPARATEPLRLAVAANFAPALKPLVEAFESETGHRVSVVYGSTGKLYAQIVNGAPFDLLLAADQARPLRLVEEGRALAETRCTYAVGQLVLWSRDAGRIGSNPREALEDPGLRHLAIANPDIAPYGAAARELLEGWGLWEALAPKRVQGEDIGQVFQMVATGNAELGLVAASQLKAWPADQAGSQWVVPAGLHAPIAQDLVRLARAAESPAARAFERFMGSRSARADIQALGYRLAEAGACGG